MADANLAGQLPNFPGQEELAGNPSTLGPRSPSASGLGTAGKGVRTADLALKALQGVRQGYQDAQLKKYDQVQTAYMLAQTRYNNAKAGIDEMTKQGIGKGDPRFDAAATEIATAQNEMQGRIDQIHALVTGQKMGKAGKQGGAGKGAEQGKEGAGDKFRQYLHKFLGGTGTLQDVPKPVGGAGNVPTAPASLGTGAGDKPQSL